MEWNATLYRERHAFVWRGGEELVELLAPQPGERILDVGCGTGELTALLAARGARVTGLDNSAAMLEQARAAYPDIEFIEGDILACDGEAVFDGIFSNAALHWVKPAERAAEKMFQALKPGGRMVVELGGTGNAAALLGAIGEALAGGGGKVEDPWYFPSLAEYALVLEQAGFETLYAILFDRMTGLEGGEKGIEDWLDVFGRAPIGGRKWEASVVEQVKNGARAKLFDQARGEWMVDYRRLRMAARKPF